MLFQILTIIILVLGVLVWSSCVQDKKISNAPDRLGITSEKIHSMSREDIQRALKNIETSPAPVADTFAMCYEITTTEGEQVVYTCPVDGKQTIYSSNSPIYSKLRDDIINIWNQMRKLNSLGEDISFTLDEKKLCSKCSPNLPDNERVLAFILKYPDGRIVRTEDVSSGDIRLLLAFFTNSLTYEDENGKETSLKFVEPRLKNLLGEE
jgi:hypothetical protein